MPGNWNSGDPNNPIEAFLNGRPLYGKAGQLAFSDNDPRYFDQYIQPGSETGGGEVRYRLNDQTQARLVRDGVYYTQLRNTNVGGDAMEIVDPSQIIYDDELGALTPIANLRDDPNGDGINTALMVIGGGIMGGAAIGHMALAGGAGAGAGTFGNVVGGSSTTAGTVGGLAGSGVAGTVAGGTAGVVPMGTTLVTAPSLAASTLPAWVAPAAAAAAPIAANAVAPDSGTPPQETPPPRTGIIDSVRGGLNSVGDWYNGLSPVGRAIVNAGVSTGASSLLGANAQRTASQEADRREAEAEADRLRRGNVHAYVNPFTPKPAGIIGSAYTPKPTGG